jgi:hypothetical protein
MTQDQWLIAHLWYEDGQWRLSMTLDNEVMRQLRDDGRVRLTSDGNRKLTFELQGDLPSSSQLELAELKIDEVGR